MIKNAVKYKIIKYSIVFFTYFLYACEYGLFNKNFPDSAQIYAYIDNEINESITKSKTLIYSLDDENLSNKILKIEAMHKHREKNIPKGFDFSSNSVAFNIFDEKTILISLDKIKTLGIHEINIKSKVSSSFDMKFIISVTSPIKVLNINYRINNTTDGIEYEGCDEGSFDTSMQITTPLEFISSSTYIFNLKNDKNYKMPTIDFICENNNILNFNKLNDSLAYLTVNRISANASTQFKICIRNSDIEINVPVVIRDIAKLTIDEELYLNDNTENIFIKDTDSTRNYTMNIVAASDGDRTLRACLLQQANSINMANNIQSVLKVSHISQINDYFSINFDGINKTLNIIPKRQTVVNNKNLYFYLYIYDANENYFGRWRIIIGGTTERVKIKEREINVKTQSSSSTYATIDPDDESKSIIWYLSSSNGNNDIPPAPLSKYSQDNIITFLTPYSQSDILQINNTAYQTNDYSFAITHGPEHRIYWTVNSESSVNYLVALNIESGKFDAVPFIISANSAVILKSEEPVSFQKASDCIYDDSKSVSENEEIFENSIVDINFPYGQEFPQTYSNGAYGKNTRTFYLPHNKISKIKIKTFNISSLTVDTTSQSKKLVLWELLKSEDNNEYILEITPIWHDLHTKSNNTSLSVSPPCENKWSNIDNYGKTFYQYIGRCTLNVSILTNDENSRNHINLKLRLILFENK